MVATVVRLCSTDAASGSSNAEMLANDLFPTGRLKPSRLAMGLSAMRVPGGDRA
jgi:hypothetical protein